MNMRSSVGEWAFFFGGFALIFVGLHDAASGSTDQYRLLGVVSLVVGALMTTAGVLIKHPRLRTDLAHVVGLPAAIAALLISLGGLVEVWRLPRSDGAALVQ